MQGYHLEKKIMSRNENEHSQRGPSFELPPYGQDPHERDFLEGIGRVADPGLESEESTAVGQRIKNLRELKGLSITDVSQRTGLPEEILERIEADAVAPPLGTLTKLARALEMKMGYLLASGESKPFVITRKDGRKPVSRHASRQQSRYGYSYLSLAPGMPDRNMEPFLVTLAPTGEEMPGSVHEGEEFLYVLDGEMEVVIGEHREVLYPGDAIYYHSTIPHQVMCHQGKPAHILAVLFAKTK
jgi:transcriptional regulator with XRE-family HTH domain